ncbi:23S rRNA (uracil(1939)-C(5))-methyltransferase RlmD [Blautia sp.]|uniref:23S rRNA (Uracil-C(5))-methyltransferase RlmCD n=1 Tax=Blautia glucerasea TaxID=536633 RepID=A0A6N2US15_9FIRM
MEYRKNDMVTLDIVDCGMNGEGIGKADGFTVFVKDAVIGDRITAKIMKAKKNYGYGRLMEILVPSPDRTEPVCPSARQCGGCQLQALSYRKQLAFKEEKVRGHLERIGGFTDLPMEPIIGMDEPFHYRNKAQFPIGRNRDGRIITGFYAGRTHSIIENRDCVLGTPQNREILDRVISYMEKYDVEPYDETSGKGLIRHVFTRCGYHTGELMVCIVANGSSLPHQKELVESLREISGMTSITLNINKKRSNVILGDKVKVLWGQEYITDKIGDISYQISPLSFYQVNPKQTWKLYSKALEYADLHGEETVWDLYCGIGTISLFLAKKAKSVRGVEIVPAAIENARSNARLNGIENAEFFVGKAEEVLPDYYDRYAKEHPGENARADVIVVDPPRKGCDETLLDTIVEMQPEKVVYVSCDSATLARDLKYLCERGYQVKKVCPVDMFPMTVHVETVVLLGRKKSTEDMVYAYVDYEPEDDTYLQGMKGNATYREIKEWIKAEYGMSVSSLYVAQIKDKCGFEKRQNYNIGENKAHVPNCPPEKEKAILEAFKHFRMI